MAVGMGTLLIGGATLASGALSADASQRAARTQADAGKAAIDEQRHQFDITQAQLGPYQDVGRAALFKLGDYLGLTPQTNAYSGHSPQELQTMLQSLQDQYRKTNDPMFQQEIAKVQAAIDTPAISAATGAGTKPFSFDISQDPGYQFRLDQGTKAITNAASATGGVSGSGDLSGATLKELLRYGQDYASGEFNAAFQRDLATKNQTFAELSAAAGMGQGATNTSVSAGTQTAGNIGNTITGIGNANAAGTIGGANAIGGAVNNIGQMALLRQILGPNANPGVNAVNQGVNLTGQGVG